MSKKKISFKEYIESKTDLLDAINNVPQKKVTYEVTKYCQLPIGESKEESELIKLKPNQKITINWIQPKTSRFPMLTYLMFEDSMTLDDRYKCPLIENKLAKWLLTNTKQID